MDHQANVRVITEAKRPMLHVVRLGPLEFPEGDQFVYAAFGEDGPVQPVFAADDGRGLRDLAAATGGRTIVCESALATAARKLGLRTGRLPPQALRFRASLAMALALGPEATTVDARKLDELVGAFARFWKAQTWERFDSDRSVPMTVAARGRTTVQEASVLGAGGEQFGLALYPGTGSVSRMTRLVDEDRMDEVRQIEAISVTFEDGPPFVRRAMEDAHGVPGFPVPLAVRRGEVRVAMPAPGPTHRTLASPPPDPVRVRLRTPRNAPCPCGSGKKYKKCHLSEDEDRVNGPAREEARRLAERDAIHALDERLTERMLRLAEQRWGRDFDVAGALDAIRIPEEDVGFFDAFAAHHFAGPAGFPPRELLLREEGGKLKPDERAWLESQAGALVSVWEVTEVSPGKGIRLRSLLGEEERFVREVAGSRVLKPRDMLLGRVVDHAGATYLCGIHPRPLPPREGSLVVKAIRRAIPSRARVVPREKLLAAAADGRMLNLWQATAEALARRPLPELRNTDGQPFLLTTDHFTVGPGATSEIADRLSSLAGAERDEDDGSTGVTRVTFTRPGHTQTTALENTIIGSAELSEGALRLSTNSVERANALRERVEEACASLIQFRVREHQDPAATVSREGEGAGGRHHDGESEGPSVEEEAMIRAVKEKHYRDWLDQEIPALRGLTPRQAAKGKPTVREELALLLAEIENREARVPEGQRCDVAALRRELGLRE